jgi:plastocyanin
MRASRRSLAAAATATAVGVFGLALGACGGGSSAKGEACPATVDATVEAGVNGALRFTPSTLTAKSGTFVVKLINKSSISHTFQIHGLSGEANVDGSTKQSCATFTLAAGSTYTYYCGISGHEQAGMKGKLTVSS